MLVIKKLSIDGVKLYWRLDGSLVVRTSPAEADCKSRWNLLGCLIATMARVVDGRSALRGRDCAAWVVASLVGAGVIVWGLSWSTTDESFGGWVVVVLALWLLVAMTMVMVCHKLANKTSWCQRWWKMIDYVAPFWDGEAGSLGAVLCQSDVLSVSRRAKLLNELIGRLPAVTITKRPKFELAGKGLRERLVRYKEVWAEMHRRPTLPGWALEMAVDLWDPDALDAMSNLGVTLDAAAHLARTSA